MVQLPVGQVLASERRRAEAGGRDRTGDHLSHRRQGDTSLLVRTGERYVWGLAPSGRGRMVGGERNQGPAPQGVAAGEARVVLDTEESNLVSIVGDGRGGCYAGGDSRGQIVHVSADGKASTAYDAAEDEVRALALGPTAHSTLAGLRFRHVGSRGGDPASSNRSRAQ